MARPFGILLGALAGLSCAAMLDGSRALVKLKENVVLTTLDNGLRVVIVEDRSSPVVALNIWVQTGSADETDDESGMAHVFEHMLFKGTERRAVGEIAQTVEGAGGNINAFTSFDMTVYHITMASRDAGVGIDVLSDAVLNSTFDPDELAKETEVVVEEIRRGEDSPSRVLFNALFSSAYTRHPYGRPVIGTTERVRSFTRPGLLDFHARWYVPNNMTFVVVGDQDPQVTLEQIRTAFAGAEFRDKLTHRREPEPVRKKATAAIVRRDFNKPQIGLAFPVAEFAHPDTPYLDLLSMILGEGETSRLYRGVKDRRKLVHSISASAYTPLEPGLFLITASLEGEHVEPALTAIAQELEEMRRFGPSRTELERARINLLSSEVHEKETMQGQARKFGYFEALGGGIEKEREYLDRIREADVDDVRRVALEYLVPERLIVAALLPQEQRGDLEEQGLLSAYLEGERRPKVTQKEAVADGIWRYRLPNGFSVIVRRNPSIPLVSLRLSFLGGLLAETEQTQGISMFLAEMLERGTEQRTAAQLSAEVEGIAGSLEGFSGRNSFGLTAEFLVESLDVGLELFTDVVQSPSFPEEEIEKLRVETLAAIDRREDNLAGKAFELFGQALYDRHPYRFPSLGTRETIASLDRQALVAYYERYAVPQNGILAVVGDVDPDTVLDTIATRLAQWARTKDSDLPSRSAPTIPEQPIRTEIEKNRQQTHLVFGFPGLSLRDPDRPAMEVLTQILSGQGGRLFLELRDRQSLAYSVSAFSIEGLDPGAFGVYIACAPEKLDAALAGIRSELEKILEGPISQDELERARRYLIGSQAVSLQRYGAQASLLSLDELYGLGADHHLGYADRIAAVSLEDVRLVAKRVIRLKAPVIATIR